MGIIMTDDKPADDKVEGQVEIESEYNDKSPVDMARKAMKEKYATMCCCCVLVCEDKETKDAKWCFCFPIKCGVLVIAASIIFIAVVQFLEIFYQLLNDHIDWWYVLVGVAISIPLIIAFGLAIFFFAEDDDGTRVGLQSAAILLIISVALLAAWNACYFTLLYAAPNVTTGNDGVGFVTVTVKQQVVFSLWLAAVICAFFTYYICILNQYKNCYRTAAVAKWIEENAKDDEDEESLKKDGDGDDKKEGEEDKKEGE